MARLGVLAALLLAAAPMIAHAQDDQRCPAFAPESDQLVVLSVEPQAESGFARALRRNGRVVANRDIIDESTIFQLIGPIGEDGFALYSPASEAFLEIGEDDLFLYALAEAEEATVIEFRPNNDGSHFLKHISARRFVTVGDGKNGLEFSARRRSDAQRFCIREVLLEE